MSKYLIVNRVYRDGLGDFIHFEDIIRVLLTSDKYKDIEFMAYVCYSDNQSPNYQRIKTKLDTLGIYYLFGTEEELKKRLEEKSVKDKLWEVEHVYVISQDPPYYSDVINPSVPITVLFEHELAKRNTNKYSFQYSLGLQATSIGIKIKLIEGLNPIKAWDIIRENDAQFARSLLINCHAEDFAELVENYAIIPAYCNTYSDFIAFIALLATNSSFPKDKNSVVYQSGMDLNNLLAAKHQIKVFLKESNIGKLEIISAGENALVVIDGNPEKSKTMTIFSGFYIKDNSYNALYHLAEFAFVSGDNSFERTISMQIFPYYCPNYLNIKKPSLDALRKISQMPSLDLSTDVREMYDIYFNAENLQKHQKIISNQLACTLKKQDKHEMTPYSNLDFQKMIIEWPKICKYLNDNHNFYHKMDAFILDNASEEDLVSVIRKN